jgi:sec-independent protein translocase protein TatB
LIDLGLTKLALIGVVALVVIGPEKLPKVARTLGSLYGRAQRYINDVKSEVSRDMELDELRKMQQDVQDAAHDLGNTIAKNLEQTRDELHSAWDDGMPARSEAHVDGFRADGQAQRGKARDFRRKKLLRTAAVPVWYKQQHGGKSRVISAAARVARYRPGNKAKASFF